MIALQTGSRNVTGPKMFPTIWGTYMKLVTKYQISAINSYWEKCDEKDLGMDRGKTVYPPPMEWGYHYNSLLYNYLDQSENCFKKVIYRI